MIFRPIKEGFTGVRRHWAMSISSALAVTVTLIIVSIFMIFSYHLSQFTKNFEASMEIAVMIDFDHETTYQERKIKEDIQQIPGVKGITYFSKEEELQFYLDSFNDEDTKEAFAPFIGDRNPMHDAYYVETETGSQINDVADAIRKIDGVYKVEYGGTSTLSIVGAMTRVRSFGGIFVIVMSLLAIFLIQNTIKLTIYARKDEIKIMRDVGASNRFIRSPFVWEGIITGFMGSIIPVALTVYSYLALYRATDGILFADLFTLAKPIPFLYYITAVLLLIGILVGLVGSWLSVTRYLRTKR